MSASIPPVGRPRIAYRHQQGEVMLWTRPRIECLECEASEPVGLLPDEARAMARAVLALADEADRYLAKVAETITGAAVDYDKQPNTQRSLP